MPTPLEVEVDKLISWCEANAADDTDLREVLTAAGVRLGQRCDVARQAELVTIQSNRTAALTAAGKTTLSAPPIAATPAIPS